MHKRTVPMEDIMLDFIKSRRSTRKFLEKQVPKDLLEQVVEAGRFAPSGGNCQSTHFMVITNPEVLDKLRDMVQNAFATWEIDENTYKSIVHSVTTAKKGGYVFHYNAPALIVTINKKDYGNNIADCSCALENMMLMANSLDLGSVWINQLKWLNEDPDIVAYLKTLGMAEDERVYGALAVGYPDTDDGMPVREPLNRHGNPITWI